MLSKRQVVIAVLLSLTILTAQTIDFDLKDYKQPEMKRHSLETSFNLGGYHSSDTSEGEVYGSDYFRDSYRHSFETASENYYSYFKHTENIQRGLSTNLLISQDISSSDTESRDYYNPDEIDNNEHFGSSFKTSMDISGYNRFYPDNSLFFIETNLDLSPEINITKLDNQYKTTRIEDDIDLTVPIYDYMESTFSNISERDYDSFSQRYAIDIHPELIFGFGKIENVSDARLAIYILQDLQDKNCLQKQPSKEEIIKLAELISTIKNERFFDAREKKIADITKIDEFLRKNSLAKDLNAAYYTSIYDNWDYANKSRSNGSRFSIGFSPEFNFFKSKYERDYSNNNNSILEENYYTSDILDSTYTNTNSIIDFENEENTYNGSTIGLQGILRYENSIPYNLNLQGDLSAEVNYMITSEEQEVKTNEYSYYENLEMEYDGFSTDSTYIESESDTTYTNDGLKEYDYLKINLSYSLRYYLNTRTDFGLRVGSRYVLENITYEFDGEKDIENKKEDLLISLSLDANYYISPKLRLSGSIYSYYNFNLNDIDYVDSTLNDSKIDSDDYRFSYGLSLDYYIF